MKMSKKGFYKNWLKQPKIVAEKYRIVWSDIAIRDVENLIEYIAGRGNTINAHRVYLKIIKKIDRLSSHPFRCRIVPELKELFIHEYRELIVKPYRIFFRVYDKNIVLVGILDSRRDLEEILIQRVIAL